MGKLFYKPASPHSLTSSMQPFLDIQELINRDWEEIVLMETAELSVSHPAREDSSNIYLSISGYLSWAISI